jgi:hypothetical protein
MRKILWAIAVAAALTGCGTTPSGRVTGDPDIDEAANDVEESKSDYEACTREQEEDKELSCEEFKEMYEEDLQAYNDILVKKKRSE